MTVAPDALGYQLTPIRKIIYVHHGSELGGAPVSLRNTIIGLKEISNYQIKVLCVFPSMEQYFSTNANVETGPICNPGLIIGRVLIGYASLFNPLILLRTLKDIAFLPLRIYSQYITLRAEMPAIVHLNSSILFSTAVATRLAKMKLIWHVREMPTGGRWNIRRQFAGWLIRRLAHHVITISPVERDLIGATNHDRVSVIYNFMNFQRLESSVASKTIARSKYGIDDRAYLLVSLGGVSPRKGTAELVEAMQYLGPNVTLIIAGAGQVKRNSTNLENLKLKYVHSFEDILIRRNLKSHRTWAYDARVGRLLDAPRNNTITFIGRLNDVSDLISASDIVLFAGTTPHFPRPIYEAWALQKPVVAFAISGVSQNVSSGVDGLTVTPMTGVALAQGINQLIASPELADGMARSGHQKALERFSLKANITQFDMIYKEIFESIHWNLQ